MDNGPGNIVHMDIELKNCSGAVWFFAAAAEIAFSFCIRDNLFIAYIEEIRYTDKYGKIIILNDTGRQARDILRFQFLAGEIERGSDFMAAAWQVVRQQAAQRCAQTAQHCRQFKTILGEFSAAPDSFAGLRLPS